MRDKLFYPTTDHIIECNDLIIKLIKVKKGDKAVVLSKIKIDEVVEECKNTKGDIYDKAVVLLQGLIRTHAFGSGNRRTAFLVARDFLTHNKTPCKIISNPSQAKVMTGIREGFYSNEELKEWLKNGKIREFRR